MVAMQIVVAQFDIVCKISTLKRIRVVSNLKNSRSNVNILRYVWHIAEAFLIRSHQQHHTSWCIQVLFCSHTHLFTHKTATEKVQQLWWRRSRILITSFVGKVLCEEEYTVGIDDFVDHTDLGHTSPRNQSFKRTNDHN